MRNILIAAARHPLRYVYRSMRMTGALLLIFGICTSAQAAEGKDPVLDAPLKHAVIEGHDEFTNLCRTLETGCGIESVFVNKTGRDPEPQGLPKDLLTGSTPRAILDRYVLLKPSLRWIYQNGVINLAPAKTPDDDFFTVKLASVSLQSVSAFFAIGEILHKGGVMFSFQAMGRPQVYKLIDLELENVTVREALNAVAKADPQSIWLIWHTHGAHRAGYTTYSWRKDGKRFSTEEMKRSREWFK